jgi:hypothetical protein
MSTEYSIIKLNGPDNYQRWVIDAQSRLMVKGLLMHIENDTVTMADKLDLENNVKNIDKIEKLRIGNEKAFGMLSLSLPIKYSEKILKTRKAKDLWDTIRNSCTDENDLGNYERWYRELNNTPYTGGDLETHFNNLDRLFRLLKETPMEVTITILRSVTTSSIGTEWKVFVGNLRIKYKTTDEKIWEEIKKEIISEDSARRNPVAGEIQSKKQTPALTFNTERNNRYRKNQKNTSFKNQKEYYKNPEFRCYICNEQGHGKRTCPNKHQPEKAYQTKGYPKENQVQDKASSYFVNYALQTESENWLDNYYDLTNNSLKDNVIFGSNIDQNLSSKTENHAHENYKDTSSDCSWYIDNYS